MLKRIKNKEEIRKIFDSGNTISSSDKRVKAVYNSSYQVNPPEVRYAVAISSKTGNSVWRNRFKRLIREALKLERVKAEKLLFSQGLSINIIFSPSAISQKNNRRIYLKDFQPSIAEILTKIRNTKTKDVL